ncbi:hypothetical protein C6497_17760 [Candidatus Poribacteria bacterium]|nr:MAG: hypothetical protein C6497_17760 [Candidatus Poribacteria bacterium]
MITENIHSYTNVNNLTHLIRNKMLRNLSRELFYFFTEKRKLAVNIDGDRPNSDYTKIGVTEKCYDFVTFYIKTGNYQMTIQYIHNHTISKQKSCMDGLCGSHLIEKNLLGYFTIMRYYYLENVLQMSVSDILQKKEERHKITQFKNFYYSKKNTVERRL